MALGNSLKDLLGISKKQNQDASDIPYPPPDPEQAGGSYSVKILLKNTRLVEKNGQKSVESVDEKIIARLPENFSFGVESQWEDVVNINDSTFFKVAQLASQELFDTSLKNQLLTSQMWSGNSPLEFTLPLQFKAFRDSNLEVVEPIKSLIKAVLPSMKGEFLSPPGPRLLQDWAVTKFAQKQLSSKGVDRGVDLMIGRFLHFSNLIISNVDCDFKSIMSFTDKPMSADCTVTFKTVRAYTIEDIENMFIK